MEDILDRLARQFPEIDVKKIQHKLPDPNKQKSIYGTRSRDKQLPISQMLYLANVEQFDLLHLLIQCVPIPSIHGGNYLIVTPHKPTQPTKSYEFMRPYLGSGRSGRVSNHTFAPDGCLSLVLRDGYRISIKQYMEQYAKHHGPSDHDISFFPMEKNRDDSRNYIVSLCFSLFSCPMCSSRFFLRCLLEEKLTESLRTVIVHEMCNLLDIQNKETWPRLSDYHAVAAGMTSTPPTHMKQFIVEYDDWKRWRKNKEFEPFVTVGTGTSPDSMPPSPYSPSTPYSNGSSIPKSPNESTTTKTPSNIAKRKLPNYPSNDPDDSDDSIQFIEEVSPPAAKRPSDSTTSGYESDCMVLDMVKADKATVVTVDIDENQEFTETVESKTKKDPKVSCKACSMKFFTTSGLQEHMRKSHTSDISVTEKVLEEDLGILRQSTSFLCRICCVAYQSKSRFDSHMNNHKSRKASFFACPHCSGTQVSKSDLEKHVKRHQAQQESEFICTHCHPHITMYSEGAYYHHILTQHNAELYYFCKRCLMGSTDGLRIYAHIKDKCLTTIEIMNDLFGVANARDIKFHPDHIDNYKTLIKLDPTTVVPLSQCNNHTMVRFGLNFTTCPDDPTCFGLCNIQRFCNVRGVEEKDPWRTTSTKLPNSQATTILNHIRRLYAIESMKPPPPPAPPATLPLRFPLNDQTSNRREITPFSAVQCFICQHVFKMCTMATCSLDVAISTCELISNQYTIALKEPNSEVHKKMKDRIREMHNEWSKVFSCMTHYNPAHIENGILSKSLLPPHIDYDLLKRNNNH